MLLSDGRASGRDLAQRTGLSEANVSRRLARLIDERSVRIIGFVPPEYLGLSVQFATYIRVRGDVDSVAADMSRHPAFSFISAGFGAWDLIRERLASLPEEYAEPLLLRLVHDLPYARIAAILDLPETTVENRIVRGRRMLRTLAADLADPSVPTREDRP